jgi:hypothetical protein
MYKKSAHPNRWAIGASILMLAIYLIPHSTLGSEIDYKKLDKEKAKQEKMENIKNEPTDTLK